MASGLPDELAKAVGVELGLVLPDVVAGDVHVLPAERQQGGKIVCADPFAPVRVVRLSGTIPVHSSSGHENTSTNYVQNR